MKSHQADYPVVTRCRVLGVSTSGFYAWLKRTPSARARARRDAELTLRIEHSHRRSRGTYGRPHVHRDLIAEGIRIGGERVRRLMRARGLWGVHRRRGVCGEMLV